MFGLFRRLFQASIASNRNPSDDYWYGSLNAGGMTPSGVTVTPENALRVPSVRTCLQVLADPVATLPVRIFRRRGDGKEPADNHPLSDVLRKQANSLHTASEFRGQMQWWLGIYHNAYAEIVPGVRGAIDQLRPLPPHRVTPFLDDSGRPWYRVTEKTGGQRTLSSDEVWHLRAAPFDDDGLCGIPRIENAADTIGQALSLQNYAARFFKNDGQAGGIIRHPGQFKTAEQRDQFLESWRKARTGSSAHRDTLLEFGMEYQTKTVSNETAQFIETRKELAVEVARIWKIPPHKIGILDRATHSNIEHQALEFLTDTLLPWLVLWEQAINRDLILANDIYFAEFNVAGLLRGDILTRYQAYAQARQWGWLSINDIRRLENMDPVPSGDEYLQPLNMAPAGTPPPAQQAVKQADLLELRAINR